MIQPHQYRPLEAQTQHDAWGIGAVVNISGQKTHRAVEDALRIVEKLEHRTGKDADGTTGDGVGIMTQIPHAFLKKTAQQAGKTLPEAGDYGVAMIFFPQDLLMRMRSRKLLEMILAREGLGLLFWRDVPDCPEILSEKARSSMPAITQCFIRRPVKTARGLAFDRKLYLARREYERSVSGTYVVSMSSRMIVYKGLFLVWQLRKFYPDLQDTDFTSALALVHSRFSTNTTPSWKRAHPNRIILHNGEINTIRGNINRMLAREETMASPVLGDEIARAYPVVETDGSDSSMLDNTLEFFMYSGIELPKAVMLCIPEPWGRDKNMSREKRDMFHYYASMMEQWDGPAAILFSDGEQAGAVLDRNESSGNPAYSRARCCWSTPEPGLFLKTGSSNTAMRQSIPMASGLIRSCYSLPISPFPTGRPRNIRRWNATGCIRPSAIPMTRFTRPFCPWQRTARNRQLPWVRISRWLSCQKSISCCFTILSRCLRRSQTRQLTPYARPLSPIRPSTRVLTAIFFPTVRKTAASFRSIILF